MNNGTAADKKTSERLHLLDILRGLAALSVVAWHWRHFYFDPDTRLFRVYERSQPFYEAMTVFYRAGWLAVDLFFVLSGFIFFRLYADAVSNRGISAGKFAALRFSRLYPLHIATFFFVLVLQSAYMARNHGQPFVYGGLDAVHGLANLAGVSAWFFREHTFNGPFWSVSIEILLYLSFFLVLRFLPFLSRKKPARPAAALALALFGAFLIRWNEAVGRGFLGFFAGGLFALAFGAAARRDSPAVIPLVAALGGAFWAVAVWGGLPLFFLVIWMSLTFGLTVLFLALCGAKMPGLGKRAAFVGNLSYSSYLLHFPLQLVFVLAAGATDTPVSFFYERKAMLLFFAVLIPLSLACHYFYERPAQAWLRRSLTKRAKA